MRTIPGAYLARLKSAMARPVIADLRDIYRVDEMRRANFWMFASAVDVSGLI